MELLVGLVVLGVIVAVAFPTFTASVRKSRRAEAFAALSAVQLAQERWRANNASYSDQLTNGPSATPPGLGLPSQTPSNYYTLTLSDASATGFTALATAVSGTSQANDAGCAQLSVRIDRGNVFYGSAALGASIVESPSGNACWSR